MAFEIPGKTDGTRPAGADLSAAANQYKFVKLNTSSQVVLCSAVTDKPYGILQNTPASGQAAEVMIDGISKVQADANLTIGDQVGTSADGQAAAYVPGTDTTKYIVGEVLTDNTVAGGIVSIQFNCAGTGRAA
jgi:hypothetical protein